MLIYIITFYLILLSKPLFSFIILIYFQFYYYTISFPCYKIHFTITFDSIDKQNLIYLRDICRARFIVRHRNIANGSYFSLTWSLLSLSLSLYFDSSLIVLKLNRYWYLSSLTMLALETAWITASQLVRADKWYLIPLAVMQTGVKKWQISRKAHRKLIVHWPRALLGERERERELFITVWK